MKPRFFYSDATIEISQAIQQMKEKGQNVYPVLDDIGEQIEAAVIRNLPLSDKQHPHMKHHVTHSVRVSKNGTTYVSVRGEDATGYKWHMVNDGHLFNGYQPGQKGRAYAKSEKGKRYFVPGTKFIEKSLLQSESAVNAIINDFVEGIVE